MKIAPLSGAFMITSIIGFLLSVFIVIPYDITYGFAFALIFTMMFVASMISMTYADADAVLRMDRKFK